VGPGSRIERAIIDKNCRIGRGVQVINADGIDSKDMGEYAMVRDGIVIVVKNGILPDGWSI
jgi:glucose-1-phosphate adenylyltransferase